MAFFWQTFDHQWYRWQQPSFPPFGKHAFSRQFHHPQLHTLRKFCMSSSPTFFDPKPVENISDVFCEVVKVRDNKTPLEYLVNDHYAWLDHPAISCIEPLVCKNYLMDTFGTE